MTELPSLISGHKVMRCDHGNTVKLDINKLQPLPQHLVGSFALECTLTDIRLDTPTILVLSQILQSFSIYFFTILWFTYLTSLFFFFICFRPAGGQSTWTATACDFISDYLKGASAVMTIKVFLSISLCCICLSLLTSSCLARWITASTLLQRLPSVTLFFGFCCPLSTSVVSVASHMLLSYLSPFVSSRSLQISVHFPSCCSSLTRWES